MKNIEINLDLDLYKDKKSLAVYQNTLEFLRTIPDIEIWKRVSSSGEGLHLKVIIPVIDSLADMDHKEFFFLARYLLGDDIARIDADINRWLTKRDEHQIMVLFTEKFAFGAWRKCGEWKKIHPNGKESCEYVGVI